MKKQQKGQGTLSSSCYDSIKYLWHKMRWGDMGSKKNMTKKGYWMSDKNALFMSANDMDKVNQIDVD